MCQVGDGCFPDSAGILTGLFHRYFETDHALRSHWRTKVHKRRVKQLNEPAYTVEESERAAGLGRELRRPNVLPQDLMEISKE